MAGTGQLSIKYCNVQHWTDDKAGSLSAHLTINKPDIILITSTSRRSNQTKIKIPGYNVHSTNKMDEMSAGVAIAIKRGIRYKIINNFQQDSIAAKIETSTGEIIVMTNYSPPRQNLLPMGDLLYAVRNNLPVIIAADLNPRHGLFGYNRPFNDKGKGLNRMIMRNQIQHLGPTFDTFFHPNGSSKPDIVLANNNFYLNYHISPAGLGPTDHLSMDIQISANPLLVRCHPTEHIQDTNWTAFKEILQQDAIIDLDGQNSQKIEEEIDKLYRALQNAKSETTPIIHFRRQNNIKHSLKFKRLTKILNYYAEKLRTVGKTPYLNQVIARTQDLLIEEGNAMKYIWWAEQLDKIEKATKDNKKFWRQVKLAKGDFKARTPTLEYTDEEGNVTIAETAQDKVKLFTNIWSQIWTIDPRNINFCQTTEDEVNQEIEESNEQLETKQTIDLNSIRDENGDLPFHNFDVRIAIKQLKDRAPGPSKLRKVHFSHLPDNIITNITHLINCSYATGIFPKQLKEAIIIMAPKVGKDPKNPTNYRPISLLNLLAKIYSKLMNNKLLEHLEANNILKESQYGFRKKRGTASLLTQLYERVARAKADKRTLVTLVLRDVKKAFDKVWIKGLVYKLKRMNTPPHLLRLINSYLNERYASISLYGEKGRKFNLETGVPQGDVLSPTLFLLLTNDYPRPERNGTKNNFILQFADDITQVIITKFNRGRIDIDKKMIHNQNVIEEITKQNEYERKWKISTNMQKFEVIAIGNRKMPSLNINNEIIHYKLEVTLLGMKISYNNFFSAQIQSNVNKARTSLSEIYKFLYLKRKLKIRLYKSVVQPLLVYPPAPLNMCSNNQMQQLQLVQNKAIRWIDQQWCNIREKEEQYKIEPIKDRIRRLAEGVWYKLEELETTVLQETLAIDYQRPHGWFRSSYAATFQ